MTSAPPDSRRTDCHRNEALAPCPARLVRGMAADAAGQPAAFAQGLGPALERFKADSFADTEAAIAAVASSGEPRGVDILDALIDSRLFAGPGGVFWRDRAGKGFDAATGAPADIPPGLSAVRLNNRLRNVVQGRARRHDAAVARSGAARAGRGGGVPLARRRRLARHRAGSGEGDRAAHPHAAARRAPPSSCSTAGRGGRPHRRGARAGGDRRQRRARLAPADAERRAGRPAARGAGAIHRLGRARAAGPRGRADRVVRRLARFRAAARGDRARHHLRRDGRHQHGPWRDGDDRAYATFVVQEVSGPAFRICSTGRCRWPFPWPSSSPARSASPSSAGSSASSTAGRWRRCSPHSGSASSCSRRAHLVRPHQPRGDRAELDVRLLRVRGLQITYGGSGSSSSRSPCSRCCSSC